MDIHTLLSIITSISGLVAGIILVKGASDVSPDFIAEWATKWQDVNKNLIASLVSQKTDCLVGSVFLYLSFTLSVSSLGLPQKYLLLTPVDYPFDYLFLFSLFLLMFCLAFYARCRIYKYYYRKVETICRVVSSQ